MHFSRFEASTYFTRVNCVEITGDNLQMIFLALNVDFNSASFDPLRLRSPPYECITFAYCLQNVRFLLLSINLAQEWLQIDTDLLRIHRQALLTRLDELSGDTNIDEYERPSTPKYGFFSELFIILGGDAHLRVNFR